MFVQLGQIRERNARKFSSSIQFPHIFDSLNWNLPRPRDFKFSEGTGGQSSEVHMSMNLSSLLGLMSSLNLKLQDMLSGTYCITTQVEGSRGRLSADKMQAVNVKKPEAELR